MESPRGDAVLALEGVTHRYGDVVAVRDVHLSVAPGQTVGLIGPNGSGKTTTLRVAAGLLRSTMGDARVMGRSVAADPVAAKRRFAFVPDVPLGLDHLTVREYFDLYRALQRADAGYAERVAVLARAMDLGSVRDRVLGSLSLGTRRKVCLVAAFALARPLLFLDEVTSALDPESVIVLESLLRVRSSRGAATLLATQDLAFAERVCDVVALLASGAVVARGAPDELRDRYRRRDLRGVFIAATGLESVLEDLSHDLGAVPN